MNDRTYIDESVSFWPIFWSVVAVLVFVHYHPEVLP